MAAISSSLLAPCFPLATSSSPVAASIAKPIETTPAVSSSTSPSESLLAKFPIDKIWDEVMKKPWFAYSVPSISKAQIRKMVQIALNFRNSTEVFHNIKKDVDRELPKMHLFKHPKNGELRLYFKVGSKIASGGVKIFQRSYCIVIPSKIDKSFALPAARLKANPNITPETFKCLQDECGRWLELSNIEGVCELFNFKTYEGKNGKLKHIMYANLFDETCWAKRFDNPQARMQIAFCLIQTLIDIHSKGYFHGDFTPANILLRINSDNIPEIGITDFGSSFTVGMCTRMFLAPEARGFILGGNVLNGFDYNPNITLNGFLLDIWSLGCDLLCMKYGYLPAWALLNQTLYELELLDSKLKESKSPEESKAAESPVDLTKEIIELEKAVVAVSDEDSETRRATIKAINNAILELHQKPAIKANSDSERRLFNIQIKLLDLYTKALKILNEQQLPSNLEDRTIFGMLSVDPNKRMTLIEAQKIYWSLGFASNPPLISLSN